MCVYVYAPRHLMWNFEALSVKSFAFDLDEVDDAQPTFSDAKSRPILITIIITCDVMMIVMIHQATGDPGCPGGGEAQRFGFQCGPCPPK